MSEPISVKVSSRHQIAVPRMARERLNIRRGDRLLVDVQDGLLIRLPRPDDYVAPRAGRPQCAVFAGAEIQVFPRQYWAAGNRSPSMRQAVS